MFISSSEQASFHHLKSINTFPDLMLDDWTAVLLLFHARDWEHNILIKALRFNPFYIGALGSQKTHETQLKNLEALEVQAFNLSKINGPIGVIPSARDAPTLVISVLAEIIASYRQINYSSPQNAECLKVFSV